MARAKRGFKARRRRNRIRAHAKGFRGGRSKLWRTVRETLLRAWAYSTRDRRTKKRQFRRLWITRVNAAARLRGMSYSAFVERLGK